MEIVQEVIWTEFRTSISRLISTPYACSFARISWLGRQSNALDISIGTVLINPNLSRHLALRLGQPYVSLCVWVCDWVYACLRFKSFIILLERCKLLGFKFSIQIVQADFTDWMTSIRSNLIQLKSYIPKVFNEHGIAKEIKLYRFKCFNKVSSTMIVIKIDECLVWLVYLFDKNKIIRNWTFIKCSEM